MMRHGNTIYSMSKKIDGTRYCFLRILLGSKIEQNTNKNKD